MKPLKYPKAIEGWRICTLPSSSICLPPSINVIYLLPFPHTPTFLCLSINSEDEFSGIPLTSEFWSENKDGGVTHQFLHLSPHLTRMQAPSKFLGFSPLAFVALHLALTWDDLIPSILCRAHPGTWFWARSVIMTTKALQCCHPLFGLFLLVSLMGEVSNWLSASVLNCAAIGLPLVSMSGTRSFS